MVNIFENSNHTVASFAHKVKIFDVLTTLDSMEILVTHIEHDDGQIIITGQLIRGDGIVPRKPIEVIMDNDEEVEIVGRAMNIGVYNYEYVAVIKVPEDSGEVRPTDSNTDKESIYLVDVMREADGFFVEVKATSKDEAMKIATANNCALLVEQGIEEAPVIDSEYSVHNITKKK